MILSHIGAAVSRLAACCALFAVLAPGLPATAQPASGERDGADIARIEAYLNGLKSLKSDFVQVSSGGRFAEGTFYLERPSKMRLAYKKPSTIEVYANDTFLIYVDTELEEVSHVPIRSTLAGFLVRDRIRLSGDVSVRRVTRAAGTISVELYQTEEPDAGRFVLTFSEGPLTLRKWTVADAQGTETHVTLVGPAYNVAIPEKVFEFDQSRFDRPVME